VLDEVLDAMEKKDGKDRKLESSRGETQGWVVDRINRSLVVTNGHVVTVRDWTVVFRVRRFTSIYTSKKTYFVLKTLRMGYMTNQGFLRDQLFSLINGKYSAVSALRFEGVVGLSLHRVPGCNLAWPAHSFV